MGETTGEGPGGKPPVWPGMTQVTVGGIGSPGREEAAKLDYSIEKPDHIQERGEITHILCPWRLPEFQKADTRHSYTW